MNGYLLLQDQEKSRAINGKKPNIAKMARRPTSRSAPTQPGVTGIRTVKAAAVSYKNNWCTSKYRFIDSRWSNNLL